MPQPRDIPTTRPASVVTSVIKIEGNEIARTFQVDSITVTKEVNRIPWAKVILLDGEASSENFQASNDALFIPGKKIEIKCGYQSDNNTIFKGIIIKMSIKIRAGGASLLVLECRDETVKMTIGRKSKYFLAIKDSDIISQITSTYSGFSTTVEATSVTHKEVVQYDCTDWDFVVARAEANGKFCFPDDGQLNVKAPQLTQSAVLSLLYGATILELDAEIDARHQLKNITSKSWSYADQQIVETEATDPSVALNGNLTSPDLAKVIGLDKFILNHGGKVEENELQAWGDALLLKRQLAKVRGRVKCKGVHTVKPGMIIELGGVGDRFNGKAFVSAVQHFVAAGDWQLNIQFGVDPEWFTETNDLNDKPSAGLLAAVHGLQTGIVTQLESDPDGENRIKVRMPIISSSDDGIWARISTLDAGKERGSFFLPEIGDEVIVGFINDDPRDAVVLGMVHSSKLPAPLTAEDTNHKKGFTTRSKMKMIFDDEKKSYTLETPAGKKIIVDEDAGEIKIMDENDNKLVMDSNGILIQSNGKIEIKATQDLKMEGLNIEMKAQAKFAAEASAAAEVKASGSLTLKGATVMIN
ncbi:MAG: type VI secretion system tip protein VgrG [Bacteroidota bacterium]|nr:type VI secretion system tip protein VgrG [Bacteroidota bacterium]